MFELNLRIRYSCFNIENNNIYSIYLGKIIIFLEILGNGEITLVYNIPILLIYYDFKVYIKQKENNRDNTIIILLIPLK